MKKILLVFLALLGTIQLNAYWGRGGWWGWDADYWGRPYYGPGYGPGYYSRGPGAGLFGDLAVTGMALAATADNNRPPEYYKYKNQEKQRHSINEQIKRTERKLEKSRDSEEKKELKAELSELKQDLKNV